MVPRILDTYSWSRKERYAPSCRGPVLGNVVGGSAYTLCDPFGWQNTTFVIL